jgi:hypothetical protein
MICVIIVINKNVRIFVIIKMEEDTTIIIGFFDFLYNVIITIK